MLDQATDIRPGEELGRENLQQYLKANWPGFREINNIRQFPGGYSNLTYLLECNLGEFVLRRPPEGGAGSDLAPLKSWSVGSAADRSHRLASDWPARQARVCRP